jgi:hypothetical protein
MSCPAQSSGLRSADAAISALPAYLKGLIVLTDGTNDATVVIYDNASAASGTALAKLIVPGASLSASLHLPQYGIIANAGLYADVTGTGAAYIVQYSIV